MKNKRLKEDKIRQFVKDYFDKHHKPMLVFHTYKQTKNVVEAAMKIAVDYKLSKDDYFVLSAAAWFHGTGYLIGKENQLAYSTEIAEKFFTARKTNPVLIEKITTIIMAPLRADDIDEILIRILLDAMFYYLGRKSFLKKIELQRKELQWLHGTTINKTDWLSGSYEWMVDYKFHTISALERLRPKLDRNLKKLRKEFADRLVINEEDAIVIEGSKVKKKDS